MEPSEVFEKVVNHLYEQQAVSRDRMGCLYRGPDNTKCAVGCLIPDEVYSVKMERKALNRLLSEFSDVLPSYIKKNVDLLNELQIVHDSFMESGFPLEILKFISIKHNVYSDTLERLSNEK